MCFPAATPLFLPLHSEISSGNCLCPVCPLSPSPCPPQPASIDSHQQPPWAQSHKTFSRIYLALPLSNNQHCRPHPPPYMSFFWFPLCFFNSLLSLGPLGFFLHLLIYILLYEEEFLFPIYLFIFLDPCRLMNFCIFSIGFNQLLSLFTSVVKLSQIWQVRAFKSPSVSFDTFPSLFEHFFHSKIFQVHLVHSQALTEISHFSRSHGFICYQESQLPGSFSRWNRE